jgi:serine/threonine-protein kinase Chk2
MSAGDLKNVIKNQPQTFTEENIKIITAQLLLSAHFMSLHNIIHRDLKPENILLNK